MLLNNNLIKLIIILIITPLICCPCNGITLSATTLLETTVYAEPLDYGTCATLDFQPPKYVTCACLQEGIWAMRTANREGLSDWKIINSSRTCFHLNEWVSHAEKISSFKSPSMLKILGHTDAIVLIDGTKNNGQDWQVETSRNTKKCFKTPSNSSSSSYSGGVGHYYYYCYYTLQHGPIQSVTKGCESDVKMIKPNECRRLDGDDNDDGNSFWGSTACSLVPSPSAGNKLGKKHGGGRFKRDNSDDEDSDEKADFDPDVITDTSKLKGHPDLKQVVQSYVIAAVEKKINDAAIASSNPVRRAPIKKRNHEKPPSPAQHLLELCMYISQRLCTPVDPYAFEIAVRSFIKVQNSNYHLKEPYIEFGHYQRSVDALERCRAEARAFMFVDNDTSCGSGLPLKSTDMILHGGQNRKLRPLPDFIVAKPGMVDPIVETVWKAVLMTQNYCFPYFNDYYGDHHSFTHTMIPFFTNMIQTVWYMQKKSRMSRLSKGASGPKPGVGGGSKPSAGSSSAGSAPAGSSDPGASSGSAAPASGGGPSPGGSGSGAPASGSGSPPAASGSPGPANSGGSSSSGPAPAASSSKGGGGGGVSPVAAAPSVPAGTPYNYTQETAEIWYGSLLGEIGTLFENLDHCLEAAKLGPAPYNPSNLYPWFLKRPERDYERDWLETRRRKKRSAEYIKGSCSS